MIFISNNNCIHNLLKLICLLQNNSSNRFDCNNCTKNYLGPSINNCYNTRVISLYKRDGSLLIANYNSNDALISSSNFRIMDVNDNCCTLLILNKINNSYYSTNQFLTIQINCICAVQCVEDVTISNL